jgi:hypothetical protein
MTCLPAHRFLLRKLQNKLSTNSIFWDNVKSSRVNLILKLVVPIKLSGKVKGSPCVSTEHHAMKAYWESGIIAPRILDFATRWRRLVTFTLKETEFNSSFCSKK